MTSKEIQRAVYHQLAYDTNSMPEAFVTGGIFVTSNKPERTTRHGNNNVFFRAIITGNTAVFSVDDSIADWCREYYRNHNNSPAFALDMPHLLAVQEMLKNCGHELVDMHHYLVPKEKTPTISPNFSVKWFYGKEEIATVSNANHFPNAFSYCEELPDMIGAAALEQGKIIGMAGCSADGKDLWQIGIDVLPAYKGKRIGTTLVSLIQEKIFEEGKIPFYGSVSCHVASQSVAVNSGFHPAWVEVYSQPV